MFIPQGRLGMQGVIEYIQAELDTEYDPLALALSKAKISKKTWLAACDRVYFDGYYGPVNDAEWKEQDGRKPYSVKAAMVTIAKVLDNVQDYRDDGDVIADAHEIRKELVPWYREIYGVGYPRL